MAKNVIAKVHVDKIVTATQYFIQLPGIDIDVIRLNEHDARELHEALGRLLPPPTGAYDLNIDPMRPLS